MIRPCADGSSAILSTAREQERLEREAQKTKRGARLCLNQLHGTGKFLSTAIAPRCRWTESVSEDVA